MPPKRATPQVVPDNPDTMTANEWKIMNEIFQALPPTAKPNLSNETAEALTTPLNLKSGGVVKDRYRQICNKYNWFKADAPAGPSNAPAAKGRKTAAKKKAAAPADDGDDDGDDDVDIEDVNNNEEDDEEVAQPKKPVKGKAKTDTKTSGSKRPAPVAPKGRASKTKAKPIPVDDDDDDVA